MKIVVPMSMVEVHRDVDRSYIEIEAETFFLPSSPFTK